MLKHMWGERVLLGQEEGYDIVLHEENEGAKALADNPLSLGRSKHINVQWHFIRDLVSVGAVRMVHVDSEWQRADTSPRPLPLALFKKHRRALINLGDDG